MGVCIATDFDIVRCNDKYYFKTQLSTVIKRYYAAFGKLTFCGRLQVLDEVGDAYEDVTETIDTVVAASSLGQSLKPPFRAALSRVVEDSDLVVARCPGIIANFAADYARKHRKPYFAESMGCAWDAYWNHSLVGKVIAPYMFFKMKSVVKNADYALYVTSEFLQKRYPCKNESVAASNVLISAVGDEVLQKRLEKIRAMNARQVTLMTTAAIDVRYKGQEFVIKAIPLLNKVDIKVKYLLVGGGDATYLQSVAKACGVEDQVVFVGRKPLGEVFKLLEEADIYIQPSLQEGLPRSVIEAMSRGCPCIGARTAGIPELIADDCVVRRKSAQDIADKVVSMLQPGKCEEEARRNFDNAKQYIDTVLSKKRNDYYDRIKKEVIAD